jgi:hypothetical protein
VAWDIEVYRSVALLSRNENRSIGGSLSMSESEYWIRLEFRVCREFGGMPEKHLRFLWCDGFMPVKYLLAGPSACIKGQAWICNGPRQEQFDFTLFLNHPVGSPSEIDWPSLLPPENATRWLAVDLPGKRIEIEPLVSIPDPAK